jgi:hypothetical protein
MCKLFIWSASWRAPNALAEVFSKCVHHYECIVGRDKICKRCGYVREGNTYITYCLLYNYSKGKAIPLQALTDPKCSKRLMLPDFKTIGTWRWQGCQTSAPAAFTPRVIVQPEGLCQWKIPMTPLVIDPATFQFVAQCLNHCAPHAPIV